MTVNLNQGTARRIQDCRVLIVDDQPTSRLVMSNLLADITHNEAVASAREALEACQVSPPDLIISDVSMPEMSGYQLCSALRDSPSTAKIPVMFVTASDCDEDQEKCWAAGGVDFVSKPINATTFRNRVKSQLNHKLKADLLETLIYTDRLTGALNRHYLDERMPFIVKDARREQHPLAVVLFDIDFFKQYNDEYGHLAGDGCLTQITAAVQQALLRPMDRLIRVGGEEFLVLLPNTPLPGARLVADRLLNAVESLQLEHIHSPFSNVTISIGLAMYLPDGPHKVTEIVQLADERLYEAKRSGRNLVIAE